MIHELKRYVAHEGKSEDLQRRFSEKTMPIFKRMGIKVEHCWTAAAEPGVFYYLVSFKSKEASQDAWAAFASDAEWKSVKAASEKNGAMLASQSTVYLSPTSFSPAADV